METNFSKFSGVMQYYDRVFQIVSRYKNIPRHYANTGLLYPAEIHILENIHSGINTVTELAHHNHKSKSAMSQIITRLSQKNMILKRPNDTNHRELFLFLTKTGEEILLYHQRICIDMHKTVLERIGTINEDEIDAIKRFLDGIMFAYDDMIHASISEEN